MTTYQNKGKTGDNFSLAEMDGYKDEPAQVRGDVDPIKKSDESGIQMKKGGACLERMGYVGVVLFAGFVLSSFGKISNLVQESDSAAKASMVACAIGYVLWIRFAWKLTFIPEKAATLAPGGSARNHWAAPHTLGGKVRWILFQTFFHPFVLFPICMALSMAYLKVVPGVKDLVAGILVHFILTLIPMSVCLHRFFSHGAYKASRPVTFILAVVSCCAYQFGPLWWSSKHRRHHKYCDEMKDPHSWARFGLGYGWFGWTMHPSELNVDEFYVHRVFKAGGRPTNAVYPELSFIDKYFFIVPYAMHAILFMAGVPAHTIVYRYTMPSCLCSIATLWFNCKFHPPTPSAKMVCNSIDLLSDPLATFHGEAFHHDHHKHPNKAQRPGADLGWYCVIRPLLALGVISKGKKTQGAMY